MGPVGFGGWRGFPVVAKSPEQRAYAKVANDRIVKCVEDTEVGGKSCHLPNSMMADLSITAEAVHVGNDVRVRAIVSNHKWANGTS